MNTTDLKKEYYAVKYNLEDEVEKKASWLKANLLKIGLGVFILVIGFALGVALV